MVYNLSKAAAGKELDVIIEVNEHSSDPLPGIDLNISFEEETKNHEYHRELLDQEDPPRHR